MSAAHVRERQAVEYDKDGNLVLSYDLDGGVTVYKEGLYSVQRTFENGPEYRDAWGHWQRWKSTDLETFACMPGTRLVAQAELFRPHLKAWVNWCSYIGPCPPVVKP